MFSGPKDFDLAFLLCITWRVLISYLVKKIIRMFFGFFQSAANRSSPECRVCGGKVGMYRFFFLSAYLHSI